MTFLFEILQEQDPKTDPWVYTATKHTRVWENLTGKLFGAIKRILNISNNYHSFGNKNTRTKET